MQTTGRPGLASAAAIAAGNAKPMVASPFEISSCSGATAGQKGMMARKWAPASTVAIACAGAAATTAAASSSGPNEPVVVAASTARASASACAPESGLHPLHLVRMTRSSMVASGPITSIEIGARVAQAGRSEMATTGTS